jgi:Rad3-related DNA helicase
MNALEKLETAFNEVCDALQVSLDLNKAYIEKIAELEKQLSGYQTATKHYREKSEKQSEPVGWYKKDSNDYFIENVGFPDFQVQEYIDAGYIPLYTHTQTKPLSDEEIDKFLDYANMQGYGSSYCEGLCDGIEWALAKVRGQ